jgi:hypothetical protein
MRMVTRHAGPDGGYRSRRRTRLRDRLWVRICAVTLVGFLLVTAWSVGNALTVPGGGSISDRLAEWARDHYLGPLVTFGEWLSYSAPKKGGKPSFALTGPTASVAVPASHHPKSSAVSDHPPARLRSLAGRPLPGEGQWRVLGTVRGRPAVYGTYLRSSSVYTSYVAGIVSMNQNLLTFSLRPGTEDPGPGNWKAQPYIASGTRRGLEATFNSGFKIGQSGGGFYLNGAKKAHGWPSSTMIFAPQGNNPGEPAQLLRAAGPRSAAGGLLSERLGRIAAMCTRQL